MTIIATSDLHGYLPEIRRCDVVLIGGDISPVGTEFNAPAQRKWFWDTFAPWAEGLPARKVIFIAGNHDYYLFESGEEDLKDHRTAESKLIYLQDNGVSIDGLSIYGTPWANDTAVHNRMFTLPSAKLAAKFELIPTRVDVLLTHAALSGICGVGTSASPSCLQLGSPELTDACSIRTARWIICGHIHSGNHETGEWGSRKVVNVCLCNEDKKPCFPPLEFSL